MAPRQTIRFSIFEADLESHTLRKRGLRVRLQELPFRLLVMLADRPGEVVTREELKQELWTEADYGEFGIGINTAVSKLRQALNDSAAAPRFIETIPKVGYRFIGTISGDARGNTTPEKPAPRVSLERLLIGFLAAALLGVALYPGGEEPAPIPVRKWRFSPPGLGAVAISPDGRSIAYIANDGERAVWVRDLDKFEPRKLAGTEGAMLSFFCWSPDSRWIGFAVADELRKVAVEGGQPVMLASVPVTQQPSGPQGGSWSPDGESILFIVGGPSAPDLVFEVPSRGGEPKPIFGRPDLAKGNRLRDPAFLPQEAPAKSLLLTVSGSDYPPEVVLRNLETGASVILTEGDQPVYSPTGHIVYRRDNDLWALPFSLSRLQSVGDPFPVARDGSSPSVSDEGTLVSIGSTRLGLQQLVWLDRGGNITGTVGQPLHDMLFVALSPNDRRVAVKSTELGGDDIWALDDQGSSNERLTFDDTSDYRPQWSESGREIIYQTFREGVPSLYRLTVDGRVAPELLVDNTHGYPRPYGSSRDGEYFIYTVSRSDGAAVRYLKRIGNRAEFESFELFALGFDIEEVALSPDGRLLAYCSNQSGRFEVYVRAFPSGTGGGLVSTNGGRLPRWSRDSSQLFYVEPTEDQRTLMAVQVSTAPTFSASSPASLFSRETLGLGYDVARDGRFVAIDIVQPGNRGSIQVTHSWHEEFRATER